MEPEEYINQVNDRLSYYRMNAGKFYRRHVGFEWGLIVLASLTPIFIVINLSFAKEHWIQWIPVVSSSLVAILTGGLQKFRYYEKYRSSRDVVDGVRKEIVYFQTSSGPYAGVEEPTTVFIDKVEAYFNRR